MIRNTLFLFLFLSFVCSTFGQQNYVAAYLYEEGSCSGALVGVTFGATNVCADKYNQYYEYYTCEVNSPNITYYVCEDSKCVKNCNATTFPINNVCEGVSLANCTNTPLQTKIPKTVQTTRYLNDDCTGPIVSQSYDFIERCTNFGATTYISCNSTFMLLESCSDTECDNCSLFETQPLGCDSSTKELWTCFP